MSACASMLPTAGIAAGDDRLEALRLDDARRQRVVGARHQHELLAGHDGAEFFSGGHVCFLSGQIHLPQRWRVPVSLPHRGCRLAVCSHGCAAAMRFSNATISSVCLSVSPMSSSPSSSRMRSAGGMSNVMSGPPGPLMRLRLQIDRERRRAVHRDHARVEGVGVGGPQHDRQQSVLQAVLAIDVGEALARR